jgi:hypothetical protein
MAHSAEAAFLSFVTSVNDASAGNTGDVAARMPSSSASRALLCCLRVNIGRECDCCVLCHLGGAVSTICGRRGFRCAACANTSATSASLCTCTSAGGCYSEHHTVSKCWPGNHVRKQRATNACRPPTPTVRPFLVNPACPTCGCGCHRCGVRVASAVLAWERTNGERSSPSKTVKASAKKFAPRTWHTARHLTSYWMLVSPLTKNYCILPRHPGWTTSSRPSIMMLACS